MHVIGYRHSLLPLSVCGERDVRGRSTAVLPLVSVVNDLQHGRYSTLSVVLCDATQVLCITETVWTHEIEVFCTSQRTGTVTA